MINIQTPILFIVFNRLDNTSRVFEVIKKLKPINLYVASDGPRLNVIGDKEKCESVRNFIINNIDWNCDLKLNFQDVNLGCGYGPKAAIDWFFSNESEGIILEDDCLPDLTFFQFCSEMLEKYRYENKISIISGTNLDRHGICKIDSDYFFSVFPYTWGWATWKRNWETYDYNISSWGKVNKGKFLKRIFKDKEFQLFWKIIFNDIYIKKPSDIWDYQFFYQSFSKRQLSVVPTKNLISNIGHSQDATHTFEFESLQANLPLNSLKFPLKANNEIKANIEYDNFVQEICYGRIQYVSLFKRIKRMIKKMRIFK